MDPIAEMTLGELNEHIATLPIDAKRIKGLGPLTGLVASDGSVTAGSGFTASKGATGTYTVTYNAPFAATPTVVVSVASATSLFVRIESQSATAFTVKFRTSGAADTDTAFNFVAFTTV